MKDTFNDTFNSVRKGALFKLMHYPARSYVGGTTTSTLAVVPDGSWNGTIKLRASVDGKASGDVTKTWIDAGSYTAAAMATVICTSPDIDYMVECTARSAGSCQVAVL